MKGHRIKISTFLFGILYLLQSCNTGSHQDSGKRIDTLKDSAQLNNERHKAEMEKARIDSLSYYMEIAEQVKMSKFNPQVASLYNSALSFASNEKDSITFIRSKYYSQYNKHNEAIEDYTVLISNKWNLTEIYYLRALCYEKLKKRQEAVNDLNEAIALGNVEAKKLYEKINPVKKKISHYVIRCCDGTISYSKSRRGTCSRHGGVCNWNEPVYTEYRKY